MKENLHKSFSWEIHFWENNSYLMYYSSIYLTLPENVLTCILILK